jgi:hypothetical protein
LIINQLHKQDNFKKCVVRPFACSGFVSGAVVPTAQLTMEETRYNEGVQAVKTDA